MAIRYVDIKKGARSCEACNRRYQECCEWEEEVRAGGVKER
jgi:hypothetical protein